MDRSGINKWFDDLLPAYGKLRQYIPKLMKKYKYVYSAGTTGHLILTNEIIRRKHLSSIPKIFSDSRNILRSYLRCKYLYS